MFLHTFNTWIIANLLHPVMFFLASLIMGDAPGFDQNIFEIFFLFLLYSFLFSIPCLLLGWLAIYIIAITPNLNEAKFLLWVVTAPALCVLEFLAILGLFNSIDTKFLLFLLPGVASVGASILIRHNQFKKLVHIPKIENHETNLV